MEADDGLSGAGPRSDDGASGVGAMDDGLLRKLALIAHASGYRYWVGEEPKRQPDDEELGACLVILRDVFAADPLRAAIRAFLDAHDAGRSVREEMAALRAQVQS